MFRLTILTAENLILEEQILALIAPGKLGYLEILAHHASIITSLQPGKLTITDAKQEKTYYAISGGFLEVSHNKAIILADAIELATKIDITRAEAAAQRAQERLENLDVGIDKHRAMLALLRAENRIKIYHEFEPSSKRTLI